VLCVLCRNPVMYDYVNLCKISDWVKQQRLDPSQLITMKVLLLLLLLLLLLPLL
jgi:hypothetical protein